MRTSHTARCLTVSALLLAVGCSDEQSGSQDLAGARDLAAAPRTVVINEVYPHGADALTDPDWVELKNLTDAAVDLAGYRVRDDKTTASLPAGTRVPAGGYLIVYCDDVPDGGASDRVHVPFKLGASNDEFHLTRADGTELDGVTWGTGTIPAGKSYGRLPDGSGALTPLNPTPGARNGV